MLIKKWLKYLFGPNFRQLFWIRSQFSRGCSNRS